MQWLTNFIKGYFQLYFKIRQILHNNFFCFSFFIKLYFKTAYAKNFYSCFYNFKKH